VITVVGAALTGCGSTERVDQDTSRRDPLLEQCGHTINAQIEAGRIPEADREYATEMCLRTP